MEYIFDFYADTRLHSNGTLLSTLVPQPNKSEYLNFYVGLVVAQNPLSQLVMANRKPSSLKKFESTRSRFVVTCSTEYVKRNFVAPPLTKSKI